MDGKLRRYQAMIWTSDDIPGTRVHVDAEDLDDARDKLEERYGAGNIFHLHNEEDAAQPRGA